MFYTDIMIMNSMLVGEPPMSHKPGWAGFFLYLILVTFPLMILNIICIKNVTCK